jgi:hypothetical protein
MILNDLVVEFIDKLSARYPALWWPKYLFHFSDILNIEKILKDGVLFSRNKAISTRLLQIDSASKAVIPNTQSEIYDYVRLYFRPLTPTLFWVEGFCIGGTCSNEHKAHCPVPVYLVFDSVKVLSIPGIEFSDGNLGSRWSNRYSDLAHIKEMPFDLIYHNTGIQDENKKREIVHHRCAEVILQDQIAIDDFLIAVVCRSYAERETLLNCSS